MRSFSISSLELLLLCAGLKLNLYHATVCVIVSSRSEPVSDYIVPNFLVYSTLVRKLLNNTCLLCLLFIYILFFFFSDMMCKKVNSEKIHIHVFTNNSFINFVICDKVGYLFIMYNDKSWLKKTISHYLDLKKKAYLVIADDRQSIRM